jgi:hypothetical protein
MSGRLCSESVEMMRTVIAFSDQMPGVCGKISETANLARRPLDFDLIGHKGIAEAEMQSWVGC